MFEFLGRDSSVVEHSFRKRGVVGSSPTLGFACPDGHVGHDAATARDKRFGRAPVCGLTAVAVPPFGVPGAGGRPGLARFFCAGWRRGVARRWCGATNIGRGGASGQRAGSTGKRASGAVPDD